MMLTWGWGRGREGGNIIHAKEMVGRSMCFQKEKRVENDKHLIRLAGGGEGGGVEEG